MKSVSNLKVTSHVGRDLLASAAAFKTEAAVVWETEDEPWVHDACWTPTQVDVSRHGPELPD